MRCAHCNMTVFCCLLQLYIVFVVADGGADLEHFELRTLAEAKSILLQVHWLRQQPVATSVLQKIRRRPD